jgi:hypothetical protein
MTLRLKGALAALMLTCLLVPAPAPASADEGLLKLVRLLIEAGEVKELASVLSEERATTELTKDPETTMTACGYMAAHARALTVSDIGDERTGQLIKQFDALAAQAMREHADCAAAFRAKAYVLSAKGRNELAADRLEGTGPFVECAELCLKAATLSKKSKAPYIASAVQYLAEGYPHAGDGAAALLARAVAAAKAGLQESPDDATLKAALGTTYIRQAELALQAKKKGDAKKALASALTLLKPSGELPSGKAGDAQAAAFNNLLFFGKANKIKLKGDIICKTRKSTTWQVEEPRGIGWKYAMGGGGQSVLSLRRTYPNGSVSIVVSAYSWSMLYTTPDGEAGGDNMGGMMRQGQQQALELLPQIDKRKKKISGRLNKTVPKTVGYYLEGLDDDDDPLRIRGYYFKGKERQETYGVDIYYYGDVDEDDAQVRFIVNSLKERPKRK